MDGGICMIKTVYSKYCIIYLLRLVTAEWKSKNEKKKNREHSSCDCLNNYDYD